MKRLITILAASTALAGFATAAASAPTATTSAATATVAKPELGSFGFDEAGMRRTTAPGDNFFDYADGIWADKSLIPADQSVGGLWTVLDDRSKERTRAIIDELARDPTSKVGLAYNAYFDTAAIEARGLASIEPWLGQIRALKDKSAYAALVGRGERLAIPSVLSFYVGQDDKRPERYVSGVAQSGLGLPDRDYYISADAKRLEERAAYVAHLTNVLKLAGEANAAVRARAILDFETQIAKVHWTRVDSRDADKTYNLRTRAQFAAETKGFDLGAYLSAVGVADRDDFLVAQPSAVSGIAALVAATDLEVLKDQLLVRSLDRFAAVLPTAFDKERFAFVGTALSGTPEQEPRWKRAVSFVSDTLSDDISKVYVERHFTPATKAEADALVKNVVAAMGRRIDGLAWMAPATKQRARAKLAKFTTKIGYPDRWRDYSTLTIQPGDALGNAQRSAEWNHRDDLAKLGEPIRRWEWGMTPMEINAYANFGMQEIVFPAAILQPPFFDPNADPAINYGAIGAVIGHEISHHFDDQGAKYDEYGRLNEWWTPADKKAFDAAGKSLVAQYNAYEALPGIKVDGALTLGENIGDLAGLTVAFDAYKASLGGKPSPVINGTTGEQRFFLGWAQAWRVKYREALARQLVTVDSHSPPEQRVSVVRNLDAWYDAFGAKPGQTLYLAPAERVRIW